MRGVLVNLGFLLLGAALGVTAGQVPALAPLLYAGSSVFLALVLITWPPILRRVPIAGPWYLRHRRRPLAVLKRDCTELSLEILRFIGDRKKHEPEIRWPPGSREEMARDLETQHRYDAETMALYDERYAAKAFALSQELRDRGVRLSDNSHHHMVNTLSVQFFARELGAVSGRLSDTD